VKTLGAVLVETGKPLALAELEIPPLAPGQVLIEVVITGVCHTQLLECDGHRGPDPYLPHCLGHEGSGVVRELGPGVTKVASGDFVILSWMKGSGADVAGTVYRWNGRGVNAGGITTWSRLAVISENRLTALPAEVPMREAALLGCAAPTGLGAVLNTARPSRGASLAVFGCGGIGLCAVAGAVVAGCGRIIAVDVSAEKLELARRMGATDAIRADVTDPVAEINRLCPGGVDVAIEATGRPSAMRQALHGVRSRGGSAVIVGNARQGEGLEIDPRQLNQGKRLLGTWGGDNQPDADFPRYAGWLADGTLKLDPLVTRTYRLGEINQAVDDLRAGVCVRPLIDMRVG
jgi:S-(hydroxymethyl)glutathione dehydrogenase/alcohol dehydrogenase